MTTVEDAQRLQKELLKKSHRYSRSEIETEYEAIISELAQLIELLQIAESTKLETLETCQTQLERLRDWQNKTEGLREKFSDRLHSLRTEIQQKQSQILQKEQAVAQQWVKDLENSCTEINQLSDDTEKLETANNLLEQIQAEKIDYINLLDIPETQLLENIERQCIEERDKDTANQIFVLFQQLAYLQQQNVYEKLGQMLSEKTEE
ncbi:hypothetical protein [Nostoc sp.]|uniref:hypothetical protein n=1 Tax=Nostoc sp. TaxID=1180 RepID=UPI002FF64A96